MLRRYGRIVSGRVFVQHFFVDGYNIILTRSVVVVVDKTCDEKFGPGEDTNQNRRKNNFGGGPPLFPVNEKRRCRASCLLPNANLNLPLLDGVVYVRGYFSGRYSQRGRGKGCTVSSIWTENRRVVIRELRAKTERKNNSANSRRKRAAARIFYILSITTNSRYKIHH